MSIHQPIFTILTLAGLIASSSAAVTVSDGEEESNKPPSKASSSAIPGNSSLPSKKNSRIQESVTLFQAGRHAKAIELARPLAEAGDADALYLMGFAHETSQGLEGSREKALEYYRKAANKKHKDSIYRMSLILLASEKEDEREQAGKALEAAAKDDPAVAGRILGEAYLKGAFGEKPDPENALIWWKRSADSKDISSLLLLARFYEGQFGFPEMKDLKQAYAYYEKAAEQGDASAMAVVGSRYLSGEKSLQDEAKGREWLNEAIALKEYSAYFVLGDYEENVKKNLKAALAEYERGKDVGQVDCMLRAADFYLEGKGTEKDEERGRTLLFEAADAGSPTASFRIAAALLSAEKMTIESFTTGYKYLLAAANSNLPQAQNELGLLYLSGKLGLADTIAGVAWLTRSAQGGYAQAQFNLGSLYEQGAGGVPQDLTNAGQLYSLAANQKHGGALLAIARLVNDGTGTKSDPVKAWAFASLAVEAGETTAQALVDSLSSDMNPAQVKEAKAELAKMKTGGSK